MIDYATKFCLAATVGPTARGADALACLNAAVAEAQRVLCLDDLRADRGTIELVDETTGEIIDVVPAPIALVSDNGPCFRGETYKTAFAGEDPLLRHVRTRVRSPQTNGVIERFFGTLKYEHLYRAPIDDGGALRWRPPASATSTTASDPTGRSVTGHRATPTSASPVGRPFRARLPRHSTGRAYGTVRPRGLRSCSVRSACAGDRSLPYAASAWRGGQPALGVV